MKNIKSLLTMLSVVLALACFNTSVSGQSAEDANKVASINASGLSVTWNVVSPSGEVTMTVSAPDGRVFRKEFPAGASPEFTLIDQGERLPDGQYIYELRVSPASSSLSKKSLMASRGKDDDPESVRATRKRVESTQPIVQSGGFSVVNGAVILAGAVENAMPLREAEPQPTKKILEQSQLRGAAPGAVLTKVRQHHRLLGLNPDQVIPDDLIVQGSACVGLDCVNGEVFNFDTIRLKENNTRISFNDTSVGTFPTRDWRLRANDSTNGGRSAFFIDDMGNTSTGTESPVTTPFTIVSGASTNSIFVDSTGRVGFKTSTPVLDLHVNTSNTPAIRLEQNSSQGFTAQTWDVAGNEANFFVRDVTSGSRLPFRIRPGAPTSSIDISADGDVGIGTASPDTRLSVIGAGATFPTTYNVGDVATFVAPSDSFTSISLVKGGIANPQGLHFGVNQASLFSEIQASRDGVATNTLALNRQGGNVGIGTSAPTLALSVSGDANKSLGGGSWQVFSDERLKNIKGRFTNGLKAVMQLQPLRYEYKSNNSLGLKSEVEQIGFGAQALQKVIPEAVSTSSTGYLQVNNDPILWTMLNAIKEQQKEIEQLKAEVRKLRTTSRRRR
ncbi:MAG TPA: tail fiber domain-containing protein [Pyrinomonadaceae bacterium]|nr:tail fiber domain-containing protein [Pyrinomonadaceae bacterium]